MVGEVFSRTQEKPGILGKMFRQQANSTEKEKIPQNGFSAKSASPQTVAANRAR
ncbi:MAG: hypothetical protein IT426_02635 [Pirellulales bacterium]|nr:hypothetical protein [Pirellulales bacterium]